MATRLGPVQNNCRIEWDYSVGGVGQSTKEVTVRAVSAFRQMAPYYQNFNGSRSWSGAWGSGSAPTAFNLGAGASMHLAGPAAVQVALTDSRQTRSFTVTTSHWFGTTGDTLTVSIPARYAVTPTNLTVTRLSEGSHRIDWIRRSVYTSVIVQRRTNGGAWTQILRPNGNIASQTDHTTKAGNKYEYRVSAIGGSGQSGWSNVGTVYTSPTTPTGISATRSGNNIAVTASGRPRHVTGYNIRDGSTQVATNVQIPWTHSNPAAASTHRYTVQARHGSLTSGWSAASNTIQLLSPPQAPSNLSPNGLVMNSEKPVRLAWKHSPVDSSPQSSAEYRYRTVGTSAWNTGSVTTASNVTVSAAAGVIEWQVRTKGQHASWSPWSAIATFTLIDPPGVAIISPEDLWTRRTLDVEWNFTQGQGRPQSSWRAELMLSGDTVETQIGSGPATSVSFSTPLRDFEEYEVVVTAAAGDVWSGLASQSVFVQVPPAAPGEVFAEWSEDNGTVTVEVQDGRGPDINPTTNYFTNPRIAGSGEWQIVARNEQRNPLAVGTAHYMAMNGPGTAAAISAVSSENLDGTGSAIRYRVTTHGGGEAFLLLSRPTSASETVPVTPGKWIAVRARVSAVPASVEIDIQFRGPNAMKARATSVPIVVESDELESTVIVFAARVPAGADQAFAGIGFSEGREDVAVGSWFRVAAPMIVVSENEAAALGDAQRFFSGGLTSPDTDMRTAFEGALNSSPSTLSIEGVRGLTSMFGVTAGKSEVDGKPAIRLISGVGGIPATKFAYFEIPEGARAGGVFMATRHQAAEMQTPVEQLDGMFVGQPRSAVAFTNAAGVESLRLEYGELTSEYLAVLFHGGGVGDADVYYTEVALTSAGYDGPAFSGSTGLLKVGESWLSASWDGAIDDSSSTLSMVPHAVTSDIERSVDGGMSWGPFVQGAPLPVFVTDTEALSNGVTMYRVTTYSEDDASSVVIHEVTSDSPSVWLSGGEGFTRTVRLPYDPAVSLTRGRERAVRRYAGRPKPVVHAGEAVTRTVDYGGTLLLDEQSPDELADLVADEAPVHLYRDPDGRHVYGAISDVQLTRESHAHWGFGFQLTETEN